MLLLLTNGADVGGWVGLFGDIGRWAIEKPFAEPADVLCSLLDAEVTDPVIDAADEGRKPGCKFGAPLA